MEWRIFFIGPMSTPMKRNLPRLRRVFLNHLIRKHGYSPSKESKQTIVKGDDEITAIIPQDHGLAGTPITDTVFHEIDNANLVIADLTGGRAAVAYELAMAHALGIYTALVNSRDKDLNFYLKGYKAVKINLTDKRFDAVNALPPAEVGAAIDQWLEARTNVRNFENPFTKFYGAPLYDISAASGLAAGFFLNFIEPILLSGRIGRVLNEAGSDATSPTPATREISGLIVVRPRLLNESIPDLERGLKAVLERDFGIERIRSGKSQDLLVTTDKGTRTVLYTVDDYVIDIPRTMFSLMQCHRMRRLESHSAPTNARTGNPLSVKMQEVLITRFFEDLKLRVTAEQTRHDHKYGFRNLTERYHVGTLDEISAIIQSGRSRTFVE